jgi:plasmid stabilization system protein ParE
VPRGLLVTRSARAQIRRTADWWRENRPAVSDLLRSELERAFVFVAAHPEAGSPCLDRGFEGVRRIHLERVRCHLFYRVRADETIEILALWHTSRGTIPDL